MRAVDKINLKLYSVTFFLFKINHFYLGRFQFLYFICRLKIKADVAQLARAADL